MELNRLRQGDLIAGVGGVALLAVMFLEWYGAGGAVARNAWEAFSITDLILALTAVSGIALAVITATRRSPALPVALSVITATLGALATLLVFYRILNQPGPNEFVDVKLGAFLGFLSVLAIAIGGWLATRDEQWEEAPVPTDVRPAPPPEAQDPPEAEPRA
jgi:multisubunit Na+/H+ antiporter MnhB subunit